MCPHKKQLFIESRISDAVNNTASDNVILKKSAINKSIGIELLQKLNEHVNKCTFFFKNIFSLLPSIATHYREKVKDVIYTYFHRTDNA